MPVLLETLEMKFNRLSDQRQNFIFRLGCGDAPGQIRHVRAIRSQSLFNDNEISHGSHFSFFKPACFKALFSVPGGISMLGFPATVTVPDFVG